MNIKTLIARLEQLPESHTVLLSSDSEGNRYSVCDDLGVVAVADASNGSNVELTEDEEEDDVSYAVVLWPT